ncbi:hypothetical protein B0F90DRAFT_1668465 [Multifurca ochricompacta]|uniref:Uncharacterized protein n=1 Tax=Multifurca ochricompacta TaxID=376703 RepID=A0AAD4QLY3_9AGAM|nr:hypothetical protein B0F90DRAFT_1668465 [Multifurca ochricompacta]
MANTATSVAVGVYKAAGTAQKSFSGRSLLPHKGIMKQVVMHMDTNSVANAALAEDELVSRIRNVDQQCSASLQSFSKRQGNEMKNGAVGKRNDPFKRTCTCRRYLSVPAGGWMSSFSNIDLNNAVRTCALCGTRRTRRNFRHRDRKLNASSGQSYLASGIPEFWMPPVRTKWIVTLFN